jgi:hypothetical protein
MADIFKAAAQTMNLVSAGLSAGTTSTLTTTAATSCAINGKFATAFAAGANQVFATAIGANDVNTAAPFVVLTSTSTSGSGCALLFGVNAAGALKLAQGAVVATELGVTTTPGAFRTAPQLPNVPDDFCPIAYAIVRTSPSVPTFTIGTSTWSANSTFKNISTLPDAPQIA